MWNVEASKRVGVVGVRWAYPLFTGLIRCEVIFVTAGCFARLTELWSSTALKFRFSKSFGNCVNKYFAFTSMSIFSSIDKVFSQSINRNLPAIHIVIMKSQETCLHYWLTWIIIILVDAPTRFAWQLRLDPRPRSHTAIYVPYSLLEFTIFGCQPRFFFLHI